MDSIPSWIRKTNDTFYYVSFHDIVTCNDGDACISCVTHEVISGSSDPVCIDIGADLGWWSLFCKYNNKKSIIHAFEPNPSTYDSLQRYADDTFYVYNKAVSNKNDTMRIEFKNSSSHSRGNTGEIVQTTTLDFLFDNISQVDIIKIDTEGHDIIIVHSLERFFTKINTLIFEFTTYWYGDSKDYCIQNSLNALELLGNFYPYLYILCRNSSLGAIQIVDHDNFLPVIVLLYNNHIQVDIVCKKQPIKSLSIIDEDALLGNKGLLA
jgi:FkbM family methyltransferase